MPTAVAPGHTAPPPQRAPLPAVSPTIAGLMVSRHQPKPHEGDPIGTITDAADGVDRVRILVLQAREDADVILNDPTRTGIANRARAAAMTDRVLEQIDGILTPAGRAARAFIAEAEKAMQPKPSPIASEIRTRLAAMSTESRRKVLADPDDATLHAVTTAPLWLTGLSATDRDLAVSNYRRTRHADTLAQLDRVTAAVAELDQISTIVVQYLATLIDRDGIDAAAKRAAAAARAAGEAA